jgi:hypothetical protein
MGLGKIRGFDYGSEYMCTKKSPKGTVAEMVCPLVGTPVGRLFRI